MNGTMDTTKQKPVVMDAARILHAASYAGGSCAVVGSIGNAAYGTFQGRPMVLQGLTGGVYGFILGSSYWASRCVAEDVLKQSQILQHQEQKTRKDLIASTISGAIAGGFVGSTNGRAGVIPGVKVYGVVGLLGQGCFTTLARIYNRPRDQRPLLDRLSEKSWWPLKRMTDAEYEEHLTNKLISVEAQIEMVDERLAHLRKQVSLPVKPVPKE